MFEQLNWVAIPVATVVSMGIGAAWYSVLAQQWIAACGFSEDQVKSINETNQPIIYVIAAACHLLMAMVLSGVIFHTGGSEITTGDGVLTGFLIWLGFLVSTPWFKPPVFETGPLQREQI